MADSTNISAMSGMVVNNQTSTPEGYVATTDNAEDAAKMVRLVVDPDVQSHIEFDEISMPDNSDNFDVQGNSEKSKVVGVGYPVIRINDAVIDRKNLRSMRISMSGFLPEISLMLTFTDNNFMSKNAPKDGDIISLYMRASTSELTYIRTEFLISGCTSNIVKGGGCDVKISGSMFVPGFMAASGAGSYVGTSKSVIRQVAKEFNLGFAFNDYDETDDYQSWIRCNETYADFVKSVAAHSWKDETSFFSCWMDLYYNICYSNINKFLLTSENDDVVDITFNTKTLNVFNSSDQTTGDEDTRGVVKTLSNSTDFKGTPFYILKWKPYNNSTSTSMSTGYERQSYSFLHNPNLLASSSDECFETLTNIPAYDQNKTDSHILLRGRCTYDASLNPEGEMARINHDFVNTYTRKSWSGIEYVMSGSDSKKSPNMWSGNVHRNYRRAPEHNQINIAELNKMYISVTCEGLCLQIMRGEKVPVYIVFDDQADRLTYNAEDPNKPDVERDADRFYTGFYIVDSITYTYDPLIGESSPFRTSFVLKRREWPTPEQI